MNSSMSCSEPSRKLLSSLALKLKLSSVHNYQIAMVRTKYKPAARNEGKFMVVDGRHLPVKTFTLKIPQSEY